MFLLFMFALSTMPAKAQRGGSRSDKAFTLFKGQNQEKAISVNRMITINKVDGSSIRGRVLGAHSDYLFFDGDSVLIADITQVGIHPISTQVIGSVIAGTALTADILGVLLLASISSDWDSNDVFALLGGLILIGLSSVPWLIGSSTFFFQRKFVISEGGGWQIRAD